MSLEIALFGGLSVRRDGESVELPQSRKTRALLAYLVLKGTPQRRDALCEVFWDTPDDPRGALRWSLSKLRPLLNQDGEERLVADRERVQFRSRGVEVDLFIAEEACAADLGRFTDRKLADLWQSCREPLLAGLELPGLLTFESWRLAQQQRGRQVQILLTDERIRRAASTSEDLTELLSRRLELDPLHLDTHIELIRQLKKSGQHSEAERQTLLSQRVLSDAGGLAEGALREALSGKRRVVSNNVLPTPEPPLRQEIRFCSADDGTRIAYATVGSGPPVVKTANWLNHLELDWESPLWRHLFRAISRDFTMIRYDSRGNGLSDWDVANLSLDALVEDLRAVVDAAGVGTFPLLGISQGCAVAVEFAVRYPKRVRKLILSGGYARGWRRRDNAELIRQREAMITLTRIGWGRDNLAYRQMFTSAFIPDATPEQMQWFNELQRTTTSPENAARLMEALGDIDVSGRLHEVSAPTLVMHASGDERVSYENGRQLAAGIPAAKFVTLESRNHLILEQEPAWPRFLSELKAFLED